MATPSTGGGVQSGFFVIDTAHLKQAFEAQEIERMTQPDGTIFGRG